MDKPFVNSIQKNLGAIVKNTAALSEFGCWIGNCISSMEEINLNSQIGMIRADGFSVATSSPEIKPPSNLIILNEYLGDLDGDSINDTIKIGEDPNESDDGTQNKYLCI